MSLYSSNLVILFPIASCLFIVMRLADTQIDCQRAGIFRTIIYVISSLMISLSLIGLLLRIGPVNVIWILIFPVLVAFLILRSLVLGRLAMLLSFLLSMPQSQPIHIASNFVRLNSGQVRRLARRLLRQMEQGKEWAPALQATRIAKSGHEILWCRSVAKYGQKALEELPEILHPLRVQTEIERLMARLAVLPWLYLGIPISLTIVVFLAPVFVEMASEFDMSFASTILVFVHAKQMLEGPYQLLVLLLVLLGLAISAVIMLLVTVPQLIYVAPFRFFFRAYHRTVSLLGLATAGRHEENLVDLSRIASQFVSSADHSRQLELIAQRLEQGSLPQAAFVESGVLSHREAALLEHGISSRSLAWALQEIAVAQTERMLRRLSAFTQVALVAFVMFFAVFYGLVAHAILQFISQVILVNT